MFCLSMFIRKRQDLNPLVTNGCSRRYHLDESTIIFRGFESNFSFLFHFPIKMI